jgi:hypothetical protein
MTLDLDAIKARLEGVTDGPWAVDGIAIAHLLPPHGYPVDVCIMGEPAQYAGYIPVMMQDHEANARFIAAARSDIPALVAEVERLRAVFRVNLLRYGPPGTDHAKIDALLKGTADG